MNNQINYPEQEIYNIFERVKQLYKLDNMKKELTIMNEFPDIYDKYPFLIKKICKGDDMSFLNTMKEKINKINNNNITKADCDVEITKILTDKYITKK